MNKLLGHTGVTIGIGCSEADTYLIVCKEVLFECDYLANIHPVDMQNNPVAFPDGKPGCVQVNN